MYCHLNLLVTDKLKVTFTYLTKTSTFHFSNYRSKKFRELPLLLGKSKIQRFPMDLWFPISNDVKVRLFLVPSIFFARATRYPFTQNDGTSFDNAQSIFQFRVDPGTQPSQSARSEKSDSVSVG